MRILFKYPTLRRPSWFKSTLDIYYDMVSRRFPFRFLVTLNSDDPTMNNPDMIRWMDHKPFLKYHFGTFSNKVAAINAGMEGQDFDILFLISDDMIPVVKGFDAEIVRDMQRYFPNLDGALHYNDACCGKDRTITLSIMGRNLYDALGYVYHPDYRSFYCDNEFTDVVRGMGKVVYIDRVLVKHDWRGWGKDRDFTYQRNSRLGKGDEDTYRRRKSAGFPRGNHVQSTG